MSSNIVFHILNAVFRRIHSTKTNVNCCI